MGHESPQGSDFVQLVRSARDGDREAFRGWLESTHMTVYRVALRILRDAQEADDVVQETYIRAWQGMSRLKEPEASLGWVCRIARNVAIDRLRRASSWELPLLNETSRAQVAPLKDRLTEPHPNPEEALLSKEYRVRLSTAVESLKPKYRVVLLLREVDGMSYEEIAAVMELPRGTVESRLHRARAQVRKSLERAAIREAKGKP